MARVPSASRERPFDPRLLLSLQDRLAAFDPEAPEPTGRVGPGLTLVDVRALPARQRAAVLLIFWGALTMPEVARLLHTTAKAVRRLVERAKTSLRDAATAAGDVVER
jgi:DNA-directed RNA polymerase specialized sigma24 family protein